MIRAAYIALLSVIPFYAYSQITNPTLDEFLLYDESFIYSNLYHAVNERCHALMISRDTNSVEHYEIEPIPKLYEVAYKDTLRSSVTNIAIGANTYTVTNMYIGYEVEYPAPAPAGHVWALISSAQHPPDEPVLMREATAYQRWMFTVSAPTGLAYATHYDLGMAIHQITAKLIGSNRYGLYHASPEDIMNEPDGTFAWEWNNSRVEMLYDINYTNYDPGRPGYERIWTNVQPSGFQFPCELSEEFYDPIGLGEKDPLWMVRSTNYPSIFPSLDSYWFTLTNGIGISTTNIHNYTNSPPIINVDPGWKSGCWTCHYVTSLVVSVTETNVTLSMTNFTYQFPHPFNWATGSVEYLENRTPVAAIKFRFDNYRVSVETNIYAVGGSTNIEYITTKERDIILDVLNHDGVNDIPEPSAYSFEELSSDVELPDPKIDEAANIHVFFRQATNDFYDSIFDYELPDFFYVSRVVTNPSSPGYATETNHFEPGTINIAPNNYNEPFADSYHFTLYPGTNSTADFVLSNGVHRFYTKEVIYSIRTNLNQYFPAFPVNDEFIFIGLPLEYRLPPNYSGEKANVSTEWMWQRWLQLNQMKVTRARATDYSLTWTNHHSEEIISSTYYYKQYATNGPGLVQVVTNTLSTNILAGASPFLDGPIAYDNQSSINLVEDHNGLIEGKSETRTFEGRIRFLKTTNVASSLSVLMGSKYSDSRWQRPGGGLYNINYASSMTATDITACDDRGNAYRQIECSWELVYPDGFDRFVDERVSEYAAYAANAEVEYISASWSVAANENSGATVDDRDYFPEVTILCEYDGGTKTNVLSEFYVGSKRTGYFGSVASIVEPVWTWDFQWPKTPE